MRAVSSSMRAASSRLATLLTASDEMDETHGTFEATDDEGGDVTLRVWGGGCEMQQGDEKKKNEKRMRESEEALSGFCVDCKDQVAVVRCRDCLDEYCLICFELLHRKGARSSHIAEHLVRQVPKSLEEAHIPVDVLLSHPDAGAAAQPGWWFEERTKYIPMRLTIEERRLLRLVQSALQVSSYTDVIDGNTALSKAKRTQAQLREICAFLTALLVAQDFTAGKALIEEHNFHEHEEFFRSMLEIARRHKVMNPEKMRGEYGKLIYLLQDSRRQEVAEVLEFDIVAPLKSVFNHLDSRGAAGVLSDKLITIATREIVADGSKDRATLNRLSREKHRAIDILADKYASKRIDGEEIKLCLYSIGDNHSYLTANRDPVEKMLAYLTHYFHPQRIEEGYNLSISGGEGGARLSHSHEKQYMYVLQSLSLWREIAHDMFRIWCLSEDDLLDTANTYVLKNTGQGLQRVQKAPRVAAAMRHILHSTQLRAASLAGQGKWIGSSVVHMGDDNVPNAFVFIDKYTQVASILTPMTIVLRNIPGLMRDDIVAEYIDTTFGSAELLVKDILLDFFRSAFDGSGADNFYDAGSCIDGRLTSAWNWCQQISTKPFYPVFKLCGFSSFDGEFQK